MHEQLSRPIKKQQHKDVKNTQNCICICLICLFIYEVFLLKKNKNKCSIRQKISPESEKFFKLSLDNNKNGTKISNG